MLKKTKILLSMKEEKLTQIAVDDRFIQGYYTFYYVNHAMAL